MEARTLAKLSGDHLEKRRRRFLKKAQKFLLYGALKSPVRKSEFWAFKPPEWRFERPTNNYIPREKDVRQSYFSKSMRV
ncbi:hypothetical protein SESBI_45823 [Sesbania bispinosa]|nr:hypothetical protein SESBI_45823 [Sesbania bispinosa]